MPHSSPWNIIQRRWQFSICKFKYHLFLLQGGFYYPFFCFYTLWFVASPAIIILGNNLIAKWVREKVETIVQLYFPKALFWMGKFSWQGHTTWQIVALIQLSGHQGSDNNVIDVVTTNITIQITTYYLMKRRSGIKCPSFRGPLSSICFWPQRLLPLSDNHFHRLNLYA